MIQNVWELQQKLRTLAGNSKVVFQLEDGARVPFDVFVESDGTTVIRPEFAKEELHTQG